MVKVNIYKIDGSVTEQIELPSIFNTEYRPDLIRKTFNVLQSNTRKPYGSDKFAGTRHATNSVGKGRGMSRVPRLTQGRTAALAPSTVGGRRAHPPKAERKWREKVNKKERFFSIHSALAATTNKETVSKRGHKFKETITLPVIIEDKFVNMKKTKDILNVFEKIGIYDDVLRAINGKHIRAGKGKRRGRKYKSPKSILVVANTNTLKKSSRNITGVDVIEPQKLSIKQLAPGGDAGRLTVFTKSALSELGGNK